MQKLIAGPGVCIRHKCNEIVDEDEELPRPRELDAVTGSLRRRQERAKRTVSALLMRVGDRERHIQDPRERCANNVEPRPVGPGSRMFDFCSSTSCVGTREMVEGGPRATLLTTPTGQRAA